MSTAFLIGNLAVSVCLFLIAILLWRKLNRSADTSSDRSHIASRFDEQQRSFSSVQTLIRGEFALNRSETGNATRALREEVGRHIASLSNSYDQRFELLRQGLDQRMAGFQGETGTRLDGIGATMARASEQLRSVVDQRLHALQTGNEQKLEQVRQTVDEKLQGTLEARLGESFKQVSDRLEQVHRGLGEMQSLATGVGDLKKVLTNVKSRGIWGEIQLGNLLEQTLAPEQFEKNVAITGTNERVEYAIKLPGGFGSDSHVWLPIDSKFPTEGFQRLVEASERGDVKAVELASCELENVFKVCARNIKEKYLAPPATTDFGVLFLPTESLFAEAIRRDGLVEYVQREYRVIFAGPTTLSALLSSLRMGLRTLAIQQRTTEIWDLLGTVKNEFGKYADLLAKVKKKLEQATNSIDDAERKTRTIHRKLRSVEAPQLGQTSARLAAVGSEEPDTESDDEETVELESQLSEIIVRTRVVSGLTGAT